MCGANDDPTYHSRKESDMIDEKKLGFAYHKFAPDENSIAGYGARLIYDELKDGYTGVVWDRQSAFGDKDIVEKYVLPVVRKWNKVATQWCKLHWNGSSSYEVIEYSEPCAIGEVIVKGSPNGSYGYMYMTALLQGGNDNA